MSTSLSINLYFKCSPKPDMSFTFGICSTNNLLLLGILSWFRMCFHHFVSKPLSIIKETVTIKSANIISDINGKCKRCFALWGISY